MKAMDSTDAKTNFGALLDAAQRAPVSIKKKGRPIAVMVSQEDFEDYQKLKLDWLQRELQIGIDAADRGDVVDGEKFMSGLLKQYTD
jgi:prevent-host-death family protein